MTTDNKYLKIHPNFKWEGKKYTKTELLKLAEEYVQTGEEHLQHIGIFLKDWLSTEDLIEIQTSGSTGKPKRYKVKKKHMMNSALATGNYFDLPTKTKALLCMPVTYIAGKLMLVRALILGWEMDFVKPQANPLDVRNKKYDFIALTPYQLNYSFNDLHFVNKIMVGGGAVSTSLLEKIQLVEAKIYETYAMTETLTHIAARQINHLEALDKLPPFQTLENVKINKDERGCLVIKAPKVTDKTIVTNDLVEIESENTFRLLGRYDNIVNSGGIKIIPEEVEQKLSRLISSRFFVSSIPDEVLGEKLILFIEGSFSEEETLQLKNKVEASHEIGTYQKPKEIYFISSFVETHSGKIKRQATQEKYFD